MMPCRNSLVELKKIKIDSFANNPNQKLKTYKVSVNCITTY